MSSRSETMDALRRFLQRVLSDKSKKDYAAKVGKSPAWLSNILAGKNIYADDLLVLIADLGLIPDFVLEQTHLDIIGKVSAGGYISTECEELTEPLFQINVDSMFIQSDCKGYQVDGESMFPVFKHGDILIAKERTQDINNLVGKDAIVAVAGEGRFLKRIERSSIEGLYNLESYNAPPMREKNILWGAQVLATLHKGAYRRVLSVSDFVNN